LEEPAPVIQLPTEFRAALESYQGPLDLLLYLIRKEEVDILDIPIGRITEQYCAYLSVLQQIDPNACGEFLVMAANLMEMKSRSLLPTEPALPGEETEDPRIELVRQLLEYKKYKERALLLQQRMEERSRRFRRSPATLDPAETQDLEGPLDLGNVSVWDLLTAFHRIQLAIGERGPYQVMYKERPVEDYIAGIRARADSAIDRRILFEEVFEDCNDIYDAIGFFLAILEMAKRRLLVLRQEELFGPIEITVLEVTADDPGAGPQDAGSGETVEGPSEERSADPPPSDPLEPA
jgi:segregation and condensation protein A